MRTIRIKLYQFKELNKVSQQEAIINYIGMIIENDSFIHEPESCYYPAVKAMEDNQTPWFLGETLFHDYKDYLISDIVSNEIEFTKAGKLA